LQLSHDISTKQPIMNNIQKIDPIILHSLYNSRPFSIDVTYLQNNAPKPIILHVHGFKGFKDWGYFNQAADYFANHGYVFVKMNFSHNGVTPENPLEFVDLQAFGHNNFSIEQSDIGQTIDFILSNNFPVMPMEINQNLLYLTGHSRGGAAVILKAFFDDRVKAVATWAGVNDLSNHYSKQQLEDWKNKGVIYIENSRTGQEMPLYYQIVEDYEANEKKFNVREAIIKLNKPILVVHGTTDETVPFRVALQVKQWNQSAELFILKGADHVFGGSHPWNKDRLPEDAKKVMDKCIQFFMAVI